MYRLLIVVLLGLLWAGSARADMTGPDQRARPGQTVETNKQNQFSATQTFNGILKSADYILANGTTVPTIPTDSIAILGVPTAAITMTSPPQGAIFQANNDGLVIKGNGSGNDFEVQNKSGTAVIDILTGDTYAKFIGGIKLGSNARLTFSGTPPTIASGFCTTPSISNDTTAAFTVTIGSSCAAATGAITFPAAQNGWACQANDITTNASYIIGETATTTTSATFTAYARTTGLSSNWTAADVVQFMCMGY